MNGRRLATTERILALHSPGSDDVIDTLATTAEEHDVTLRTIPVGDSIADAYDPTVETLGVTLGGDGTYLEGVRAFAPRNVPFVGVNTGTLAFLASVSPADLPAALTEVLRGKASIDDRQQLRVQADDLDCTGINDVMVEHPQPDDPVDRKITRLEVFVDGEYVGEYEGSGVAVATPTGSTGVSLSTGGPIHYPRNNATLQVVPLHTHRLGVRPLVVDADADVEIVPRQSARMLVDGGRAQTSLARDDVIRVTGADTPALVVHTSFDDQFFTSVAEKLGWGLRDGREDVGTSSHLDAGDQQPDEAPLTRARRVAEEAARSTGPQLRESHGAAESVEIKSDAADIVTDADYRSEHLITTAIENEFPDHGIVSEETVRREGDGRYTWLVDPLDGTGNFAHGNPNYAVSIGLLAGDDPVMGVVYAPETDELFSAVRGDAARRNGEPIGTTGREALAESMLLSGYDPDGSFLAHCYHETRGVRRLGSAALNLCFLASGSADAVWEYDTYPWDVAAGVVIARAAGARITDVSGNPYRVELDADGQRELLGSNGRLHGPLLDHLTSFERAGVAAGD